MGWVVRLVEVGTDKPGRIVDVLEMGQLRDLHEIADLGLTLAEAKQLLGRVQQAVVAAQAQEHVILRPDCESCGGACQIKDWRVHQVATLFGAVEVRLPRFRCAISWPSHCRSTPELDQLRAHPSALMPYRVARAAHHNSLKVQLPYRHSRRLGDMNPMAPTSAPPRS